MMNHQIYFDLRTRKSSGWYIQLKKQTKKIVEFGGTVTKERRRPCLIPPGRVAMEATAPRQDGEYSSGSHGGGAWHFDLRLSREAADRFLTCHIYKPLSRRSGPSLGWEDRLGHLSQLGHTVSVGLQRGLIGFLLQDGPVCKCSTAWAIWSVLSLNHM